MAGGSAAQSREMESAFHLGRGPTWRSSRRGGGAQRVLELWKVPYMYNVHALSDSCFPFLEPSQVLRVWFEPCLCVRSINRLVPTRLFCLYSCSHKAKFIVIRNRHLVCISSQGDAIQLVSWGFNTSVTYSRAAKDMALLGLSLLIL